MTADTLLSMRSVRRCYRMGDNIVRALDGVDLEIRRGEFVMLMGSSEIGRAHV